MMYIIKNFDVYYQKIPPFELQRHFIKEMCLFSAPLYVLECFIEQ